MTTILLCVGAGLVCIVSVIALALVLKHTSRKPQEPNTMVLDEEKGRYFTYIDWGNDPPGNPRRYKDHEYYIVRKPKNTGRYGAVCECTVGTSAVEDPEAPVENPETLSFHYAEYTAVAPPDKIGILPEKLYRALHDEVSPILFEMPASTWQKIGTVGMYLLIAGMGFLLICLK